LLLHIIYVLLKTQLVSIYFALTRLEK
jgi:hypothetical protein